MIILKKPKLDLVKDMILPDSNVIADYKFYEGGGNRLQDYSLYRNHGTVEGASWVNGKQGYALDFDGTDDYVNIDSIISVFNKVTGTVLVWFAVANSGVWADGLNHMIFQVRTNTGNTPNITLYKTNGNVLRCRWRNSVGGRRNVNVNVSGWTDTKWHCLGMTWDTNVSEMKAFLEGVQTGLTQTSLGVWTDVANTARIGSRFLNDLNWNGKIGKTIVLKKVLKSEEIRVLYEENK